MAEEKTGDGKVTNRFILPGKEGELTLIGEYLAVDDKSIVFGNGHVIKFIKSIRLCGGQLQIGGKYENSNQIYTEYEQISMIPIEHIAREIMRYQDQLDEHNSKHSQQNRLIIFSDPMLQRHRLPISYTISFKIGQTVMHKPKPYYNSRRRVIVSEEPREVKIKNISLNAFAFDCTEEVEIEPTDDCEQKDFKGGWTHKYLIRSVSASTDDWPTSFAALIHNKIERAQELGMDAYMNCHCLDPSTLPLNLVKGSAFYGNKDAYEMYKNVITNAELLASEYIYHSVFEECMSALGRKGIKHRMKPSIAGETLPCTHSMSNESNFGTHLSNFLFHQCLEKGYLQVHNIQLVVSGKGYVISFETTLNTSPWLRKLLGADNMSVIHAQQTECKASGLEDFIVSYHTKKSTIIIKKFSYKCVDE